MNEGPTFVWDVFERAQTRTDRYTADHRQWAADEAADAVLDAIESGAIPITEAAFEKRVANIRSNRSSKHRRRAAIKATRYDPLHRDRNEPSHFEHVAAVIGLAEARARLRPAEWDLLEAAGSGVDYAALAADGDTTITAIKKRVARARGRLAA